MLPVEILGVSSDGQHPPVVILRHEERVLLILVGHSEAEAIHLALIKHDLGRPMTHDLICNLLAGLRAELKSTNIYKLENETFYAFLSIEQKSSTGQVEQVLLNLAVNAREAMPGGGQLTVVVEPVLISGDGVSAQEPRKPGEYVLLSVSDTGSDESRNEPKDIRALLHDQGRGKGERSGTGHGVRDREAMGRTNLRRE